LFFYLLAAAKGVTLRGVVPIIRKSIRAFLRFAERNEAEDSVLDKLGIDVPKQGSYVAVRQHSGTCCSDNCESTLGNLTMGPTYDSRREGIFVAITPGTELALPLSVAIAERSKWGIWQATGKRLSESKKKVLVPKEDAEGINQPSTS
jgi:hypothetical protein